MRKSIRILLIVLCVFFALVLAYSGYRLYDILHTYHVSEKMYDQLSNQYVSAVATPTVSARQDSPAAPSEVSVEEEHSPIHVNFSELLAQNSDVVGWIYGPDSPINYPVARAEDNDTYLYNFIDGTYTGAGTPFVDCLCPGDFSGQNTIIYGHHMNDGSMFASLSSYRKEGYYEAHPVLYLNTPSQNYRLEVFAGYVTDAGSDSYLLGFSDDGDYLRYLDSMKSQSNFTTPITFSPQDRIVTLSTCSYEFFDARYVVQCKLVPIQ